MKARTIVLASLLVLVGAAVSFAADPMMGTWKLNEAKSKFGPGTTKNTTVTYEAAGDNVKVTTDGTDGDGKPLHTEWTGKFDGMAYPVTGEATGATRTYKKLNDHTMTFMEEANGKTTLTGRIVISPDRKTRTVTTTTTNSMGNKSAAPPCTTRSSGTSLATENGNPKVPAARNII
jgi:hypothetical protein